MTDTLTRLQAQDRFLVRQRFTAMVNRYDITTWTDDGSAGQLLATSQQARLKMREEVTFYVDAERRERIFGFKSRKVMDIHGQTDVFDGQGGSIGSFRKDFSASLLRSTGISPSPTSVSARGTSAARSSPSSVASGGGSPSSTCSR